MKKCSMVMICLIMGMAAIAQGVDPLPVATVVPEYRLQVTLNKTTNLLFPYAIKSIDKGSRDILVQKAKGVENVLRVKAAGIDFKQTNLSIITADGVLYGFNVNYADTPSYFNFRFNKPGQIDVPAQGPSDGILFTEGGMKADELDSCLTAVAAAPDNLRGVKEHDFKMLMKVSGIYIKDDMLFFKLTFANKSDIGYDVDHLRFFIRDKKRVKRTAAQELEFTPVESLGNTNRIAGEGRQFITLAFEKFTIPQKKYLTLELSEKHGGRLLELKLSNKTLLKAKKL